MGAIRQDIHYALRTAYRSRGFVLGAVCTLALGIGANTAIFSIVSGVLLRPLPFANPERLVQLNQVHARFGIGAVSIVDLDAWRAEGRSFAGAVAYGNTSRNLLDVAEPERIQTVWAERGLFRLLGAGAMAGRTFRDDDPAEVAVVSAGLCRRRFGAGAACIGRRIRLDNELYTVIGVMPERFQFPYRATLTEMWIPFQPPSAAHRRFRVDTVVARLQPGVTMETALREMAAISERLGAQYPEGAGQRPLIRPLSEIVIGQVRAPLLTLLGAAGLVLFIACANVANLLLARAARRTHEMSVRAALGASRWRLIRQLLTESTLLSLAGGAAGLGIAAVASRLILKLAAAEIPRAGEIGLDWRVFCVLLAASAGTGIAFGILPALAASRVRPPMARSVTGWGGRRLRDSLVVAEIALSFVLLVGAGLLLRAFVRLQNTPAGMAPENVLTLRLTVSLRDYAAPGSYGRYLQQLESRIRTVPGVRSAGFIQYLPLQNYGWFAGFTIPGRTMEPGQTELRYVSPGYFEALGIPVKRGRALTDADTPAAPRVILINEALARQYFPNEDPVGRRLDRGLIVGVVGDVRTSRLDLPATPEVYYAFAQNPAATSNAGVALVVKTHARPESLARAVQDAIHALNPAQVIFGAKSMDRVIADSLSDIHLYLWLIGGFAALALVLAVSGVYAVISFVVAARTQEFGLRVALGAGSGQILRLVFAHGARLVAFGVIFGVGGALAAARLLGSLLRGVTATDAPTLAAVAIVLAAAGLAACLAPARYAMRVDPNLALKYE
jgi:predicted permease